MSNSMCGAHDDELGACRDDSYALFLKMIAIAAILTAGVCGVSIPLVGKKRRLLHDDSNIFVPAKAFAAGVILATGFVHMLPDATSALTDSCLPTFPWSKFPFSGFIAMMSALATLLADFVGTQFYKRKQEKQRQSVQADSLNTESEPVIVPIETRGWNGPVFREEERGTIHIVGMHADATHHVHSHPHEQGGCEGHLREHSHGYTHAHGTRHGDEEDEVLEFGIVLHSAIIGLSLGVSRSPCTVRPLIGALSFHQFFEGLALGGCISQANFSTLHSTLTACFFSLTAPVAIAVGIGVSSTNDANSQRALLTEGIFDSVSAGVLVYLALVDLIAADFLGERMSCNVRLQVVSYIALCVGAASMSSLAIWA